MHSPPDGIKFVSIADCEICSRLGDTETSFYKHAHEDETRLLPPESNRLVHVPEVEPTEARRHADMRRCPICGTFYSYRTVYEYLATGSEDEEILTRLTPTQAKRFLSDDDYSHRIDFLTAQLQSPVPLARRFAGKCLASHHLDRNDLHALTPFLPHPDAEVTRGALSWLHGLLDDQSGRAQLNRLVPQIEPLGASPDEAVSRLANSIANVLRRISAQRKH